jgi:hypothetical protein
MVYLTWQEEELRRLRLESPVASWMHGVRFLSNSKGRGKRRRPRVVTLLQFDGDSAASRWRSWRGGDRHHGGRCPWDIWATEVLGPHADGGMLRDEFESLIRRGRF